MYHKFKEKMKKLNEEIILTTSSMKQLSMFSKINVPFKAIQFVVMKGIKKEEIDTLNNSIEESGSKKVFISREYDGSERYLLIYPAGTSIEFFPQSKSIVFLS